ncbi:Bax inhibitor-1/YccA family protein [Dongshaea marina]|uniref:Bax inhibitor-1/YccA family protein n=1 Tax=Dongshaea marina TaxID=2047966 RepID=UPI000D3ED39D|nr:Bax inhibitor-1/YccA family protein [Dongshaea marina]
MHQQPIRTAPMSSALSTNQVLRNTYLLLSITLLFSAAVSAVTIMLNLPSPGLLITLVGMYGLMFLTVRNQNRSAGLLCIFAFTGFMGYVLGPILNMYFQNGGTEMVMLALGGTAMTFLALSAYVLMTGKDMSFMGGMLVTGFWILVVAMIASFFIHLPAFQMMLSALFILFSSGIILYKTSEIIHGGERSYISATLTLYVSLYNIFLSLLSIISGSSRN